jgi:hypothetical protein
MKIGLSYSRCVRDIVEGTVDIGDVLVIISRTDFDPRNDEQWSGIWRGYSGGSFLNMNIEWGQYDDEDEQRFRDASIKLYESGKLHQPRQFGTHPRRLPYYWLETIVANDELENSPAVKDAWQKFQMISGLKGTPLKAHNE